MRLLDRLEVVVNIRVIGRATERINPGLNRSGPGVRIVLS